MLCWRSFIKLIILLSIKIKKYIVIQILSSPTWTPDSRKMLMFGISFEEKKILQSLERRELNIRPCQYSPAVPAAVYFIDCSRIWWQQTKQEHQPHYSFCKFITEAYVPVLSAQLITAPTGRPNEMRNFAPEEPPRPGRTKHFIFDKLRKPWPCMES